MPRMKMRKMNYRSAFTLVELLLVLVILAVLAAVVVPKFTNRSEQARIAAAKTDVRIIETALDAFEIDNGAHDLEQLYDRMTSRLGPLAVMRSTFVNTHIPEKAVKLESVLVHSPQDPHAKPDASLRRPLRLLPQPEPIIVTFAEVPDGPPPEFDPDEPF